MLVNCMQSTFKREQCVTVVHHYDRDTRYTVSSKITCYVCSRELALQCSITERISGVRDIGKTSQPNLNTILQSNRVNK